MEFDLSIFSQGIWLLSRGETPFVSIRGLHLFGEHATYVHLLVAPLYRVLPDPRLLLVLYSAAMAYAALVLHRIAREEAGAAAALVVVATYLAQPALQYSWLEYYQPDGFALAGLLLAFDLGRKGRARAAFAAGAFALLAKENMAPTLAAIGCFLFATGRRGIGATLAIGSAAYVVALLGVSFPYFHPGGYVYSDRLYGDFAPDLSSALAHLAHPARLAERMARAPNGTYLFELFAPLAFLPLAAPGRLLLAAQLPLNLAAAWPYAHEIRYHYSLVILPFLSLAVVGALVRTRPGGAPRRWLCAALLAAALAGQWTLAPPWTSLRDAAATWRHTRDDAAIRRETRDLLARIPPEAGVSADYRYLAHLSRRRGLWMFPDTGPPGATAEYILVDADRIPAQGPARERYTALLRDARVRIEARTARGATLLRRAGGE